MSGKKANSDWFKEAVFYALHIRAFNDSHEDGIGDPPGAIEKLDYLEDLGVDTLWLWPFDPSPLKDNGDDVSNHTDIHCSVRQWYRRKYRWFQGKAKVISTIEVDKFIPLKIDEQVSYFLLLEVSYIQRLPELYFLPVSFIPASDVMEDVKYNPLSVISRIDLPAEPGFMIDSGYYKILRDYLFYAISIKHKVKFNGGALVFSTVFSLNSRQQKMRSVPKC